MLRHVTTTRITDIRRSGGHWGSRASRTHIVSSGRHFVVLLYPGSARSRASDGPARSGVRWNRAAISGAVASTRAIRSRTVFASVGVRDTGFDRQPRHMSPAELSGTTFPRLVAASAKNAPTWGASTAGTEMTVDGARGHRRARWFDARRGVVTGALSAANATGQLIFLPLLARLIERTAGAPPAGRDSRRCPRLRHRAALHA